jgi:hypothetical protein
VDLEDEEPEDASALLLAYSTDAKTLRTAVAYLRSVIAGTAEESPLLYRDIGKMRGGWHAAPGGGFQSREFRFSGYDMRWHAERRQADAMATAVFVRNYDAARPHGLTAVAEEDEDKKASPARGPVRTSAPPPLAHFVNINDHGPGLCSSARYTASTNPNRHQPAHIHRLNHCAPVFYSKRSDHCQDVALINWVCRVEIIPNHSLNQFDQLSLSKTTGGTRSQVAAYQIPAPVPRAQLAPQLGYPCLEHLDTQRQASTRHRATSTTNRHTSRRPAYRQLVQLVQLINATTLVGILKRHRRGVYTTRHAPNVVRL